MTNVYGHRRPRLWIAVGVTAGLLLGSQEVLAQSGSDAASGHGVVLRVGARAPLSSTPTKGVDGSVALSRSIAVGLESGRGIAGPLAVRWGGDVTFARTVLRVRGSDCVELTRQGLLDDGCRRDGAHAGALLQGHAALVSDVAFGTYVGLGVGSRFFISPTQDCTLIDEACMATQEAHESSTFSATARVSMGRRGRIGGRLLGVDLANTMFRVDSRIHHEVSVALDVGVRRRGGPAGLVDP